MAGDQSDSHPAEKWANFLPYTVEELLHMYQLYLDGYLTPKEIAWQMLAKYDVSVNPDKIAEYIESLRPFVLKQRMSYGANETIGAMNASEKYVARELTDLGIEIQKNGCPDFICSDGHKLFFVEVKWGNDQVRKSQKRYMAILRDFGIESFVLRYKPGGKREGLDELKKYIKYGITPTKKDD